MKEDFKLTFKQDYFQKGDFINNQYVISSDPIQEGEDFSYHAQVITKPKRKWYQVLFQYLTFGIYKAKYTYKLKLL